MLSRKARSSGVNVMLLRSVAPMLVLRPAPSRLPPRLGLLADIYDGGAATDLIGYVLGKVQYLLKFH